jgi:hypothetical protein
MSMDRWTGMSDEDDPMLKPDGHRYEAPETKDTRVNKEVAYAVLGLLVIVLAVLIATGTVPIYPGG